MKTDIGDIVGNYKITKKINEGGFGEIYQAEHQILQEKACLKINIEENQEAIDMLMLEAKILWRLNEYHSIPGSKDVIKIHEKKYVMVMDYIEGQTLDSMIKDKSKKRLKMHQEDACWITERVLGALYYCHYNGVIHGDVKPENIFIEPKKRDIKLIDFGLAVYKPTGKSIALGYTERYCAPEILDGKPPIPESDIYGAGIVLLYTLGGNVDSKLIPKNVSEELSDFCNELLSYDPAQRPSWDNENPIKKLSDIRFNLFGRRHIM